jgi:hypothetical protein
MSSGAGGTMGGGGMGGNGDMGGSGGTGGGDMGGSGGTGGGDMGGVGGGCTSTASVAIATTGSPSAGTMSIAVDDTSVYFTGSEKSTLSSFDLWRAPLDASSPAVDLGSLNDSFATYVLVNDLGVYTLSGDGQLLLWPKAGGAPTTLSAQHADRTTQSCLYDAYGYLYVCNFNFGNVQLVRRPEDGSGTTTTLVNDNGLDGMAFDPTMIWVTDAKGVNHMAPDGTQFAQAIANPYDWATSPLKGIAVDGSHVFVGAMNGQVLAAPKQDGATLTPIAQTIGSPETLLVDGGNLYVLAATAGSSNRSQITRMAPDGSHATMLVDRGGLIGGMDIRGSYVYYTLLDDGTVYRVCK